MFGHKQTFNIIILCVLVGLSTTSEVQAAQIAGNGGFEVEGPGGPSDSAMWEEDTFGEFSFSERTMGSLGQGGEYVHRLECTSLVPGFDFYASVQQHSIADAGGTSLQPGDYVAATLDAEFGVSNSYSSFRISLLIIEGTGKGGTTVAQSHRVFLPRSSNSIHTDVMNLFLGNIQVPDFGPAPADAYSAVLEMSVRSFIPMDNLGTGANAYIDNVQIYTGPVPLPEPCTLALFGFTSLLLCGRCRVNRAQQLVAV